MAKDTIRDRIWDTALTMTVVQGEAATPDKLADVIGGTSKKTVSETLLTMSEKGWLVRETRPDGTVRYLAKPENKLTQVTD